jgi:uncharacterized membrane-anchored protein
MNASVKSKWIMGIAIGVGIFVLSSAWLSLDAIRVIRSELFQWAAIVSAFLLALGILDYMLSRLRHIGNRSAGFFHNFLSFAIFLVVIIYWFSNQNSMLLNEAILKIQTAMEATLSGLVTIAMIYGLYRTSRSQGSLLKSVFLLSVIVFLVLFSGVLSFFELPPQVLPILEFIRQLPVGGVYGLLIGLSIGALVTGIRVLLIKDSSSREKLR